MTADPKPEFVIDKLTRDSGLSEFDCGNSSAGGSPRASLIGRLRTQSEVQKLHRRTGDIHDIRDTTGTIMSLHPVEFRYKGYGTDAPVQYGLIAEEVAEIAPELAHNAKGDRNRPLRQGQRHAAERAAEAAQADREAGGRDCGTEIEVR